MFCKTSNEGLVMVSGAATELHTGEHNWAGNLMYGAAEVRRPATVVELQELVAGAPSLRALGSRHSFNRIADTSGVLVSLEHLAPAIDVDPDNLTVTVSGGTRYGTLAAELQRQGFALHNLASLPHISVAGAVATATHGSGDRNGNLATAVAGLEIVTADGGILTARRGDPDFDGMVVNLGALGVVSSLTLDIEPTYDVAQTVFEGLGWDEVLANFDGVTSAAYSVSLFTDWGGDRIAQAWLKSRKAADADGGPQPTEFFGGSPATEPRHPIAGVPGTTCTQQLGVPGPWSDRLSHFRMEFTPSKGDELQSEYLVPREHATDAIRAMRRLSHLVTPLLLVSEIRTMAADSLWLSPNYRTDGIGLHLTWRQDQPAVEAVLPVIEAELAPFGARPHWGKLFDGDAARLAPLYPRFADFKALAGRLDPKGKFRNGFLDRAVFGS
jgi:xylitol oxidase